MKSDKGKPQVQIQTAFGAQQLTLNDNRPSLAAESLFFFENAVALKAYQLGSDELIWMLTSAVYFRLIAGAYWAYLIGPMSTAFLLGMPIAILLIMFSFLWSQSRKTHGSAIMFRVALIIAGVLVACL